MSFISPVKGSSVGPSSFCSLFTSVKRRSLKPPSPPYLYSSPFILARSVTNEDGVWSTFLYFSISGMPKPLACHRFFRFLLLLRMNRIVSALLAAGRSSDLNGDKKEARCVILDAKSAFFCREMGSGKKRSTNPTQIDLWAFRIFGACRVHGLSVEFTSHRRERGEIVNAAGRRCYAFDLTKIDAPVPLVPPLPTVLIYSPGNGFHPFLARAA